MKLHLPTVGAKPVIVDFDAGEVLSARTGTEIHVGRPNARVINLLAPTVACAG
jgi:hypothetical protein